MSKNNVIEEIDNDLPKKIDKTVPRLSSFSNKLFVIIVLALFVIIIQSCMINSANKRAETNTELMFVKMYPNGSWDVEYRKSGNEADFFPLTIDKLINDYVEARYSVIPGVMRRQYGFSSLFMSPQLRGEFLGSGEKDFNAPVKAEFYDKAHIQEDVKIRFVDHFDISSGSFVHGNSDVYRTNVFIERQSRNKEGMAQGDPVNEVVTLHWRIRSVKELQKFTRDELRANPIGLEILKSKIVVDNSERKG